MRALLASVAFVSFAAVAQSTGPINLDKPGALETLRRDNPTHYEAVLREVRDARRQCRLDKSLHPADREGARCKSYLIDTVFPGRIRLSVPVDDRRYLITVRLEPRERLTRTK